ncbi:MAG: hypothetical protein KBD63_01115 [Bacteriovoracaceae bacterium]|nr:hypothetical protein [Bacteriovoracaceae bacterium]
MLNFLSQKTIEPVEDPILDFMNPKKYELLKGEGRENFLKELNIVFKYSDLAKRKNIFAVLSSFLMQLHPQTKKMSEKYWETGLRFFNQYDANTIGELADLVTVDFSVKDFSIQDMNEKSAEPYFPLAISFSDKNYYDGVVGSASQFLVHDAIHGFVNFIHYIDIFYFPVKGEYIAKKENLRTRREAHLRLEQRKKFYQGLKKFIAQKGELQALAFDYLWFFITHEYRISSIWWNPYYLLPEKETEHWKSMWQELIKLTQNPDFSFLNPEKISAQSFQEVLKLMREYTKKNSFLYEEFIKTK